MQIDANGMTTKTLRYTDWREREVVREVNFTIPNICEFKGRAGMPWLIMAANIHLSINELLMVMKHYGYERTRSWVSRRRWIFFDPNYVRSAGGVRDADGKESRAFLIMEQHPRESARRLVGILRENGIKRGKDWVLKNRVR